MGYNVPHMKTEWLKIRASQADLDALQSVSETLVLDASTTLWFVVHEKLRDLRRDSPPPEAGSKKKRRSVA